MPYPPSSGSSAGYVISLDTVSFFILLAVLALFFAILIAIRARTSSKRALEGFIEATSVDIVFLAFSVLLVVYLAARYPSGNHLAYATAEVVLNGEWLTFAIPIVTVGNTVHVKTRGSVAWRGSSIAVAGLLFLVFLYLVYTGFGA